MKASEAKKKKMREYAKAHREQYNEYQKKYIQKLKAEGKKPTTQLDLYRARINKAIEYISDYKDYCDENECDCTPAYFEELLDILKGSDTNE